MSGSAGYGSPRHLATRWLTSLWPGGPDVASEAWARRWLTPEEQMIWARMSGPDRRHAVGVSRRVAVARGNPDGAGVPTAVLAAALLHDAGKVASGLGTNARAVVTLVAVVAGRTRVAGWAAPPEPDTEHRAGWARRAGLYVTHDRVGAEMLRGAGSDPLVADWAEQHHLPPERWTVDADVGATLKAADDD